MSLAQRRGLALWAALLSAVVCLGFLPASRLISVLVLMVALGLIAIIGYVTRRSCEQDVALRREDLGDVPLDLHALLAALVEAVEQEQRTARRHGLAQHQVRGLVVLKAEEGVDPVPRRPERVRLVEQPGLQQLHLDEDGNELGVCAVKHVHDDLVEQ